MDERVEPEIVLCGAASPIANTNDCPREAGHDGEHYCWGEGKAHGNTYGITVMTFAGEKVEHYTMEGRTKPEHAGAVVRFGVVTVRCVGCGATREIDIGSVPVGEVPMCEKCFSPCVVVSAKAGRDGAAA